MLQRPGLLNLSIPASDNKGKIYSKIEGKGLGNYYYFSAISAIISGILFEINNYIPMTICVIINLIAARITINFTDIQEEKTIIQNLQKNSSILSKYKKYFKDLRLAFSFIFTSKRLKSLMLYSAIMYGMIIVLGTYEMGLLEEIRNVGNCNRNNLCTNASNCWNCI